MSILADLDDQELFAPHFRGTSWAAWRAFLATLFALPMDDAALALYRHHTGRTVPPVAPFPEAALICGRRGGKSRVLALLAVWLATWRDYAPFLAAGEVATIPIVAVDRKQARTIFRYTLGLIVNTPALVAMKSDETAESVTLNRNVTIEVHTASYRGIRGYTLAAALVDEVAFLRDETSANPDEELLAAVRPGLSSIPGSVFLLASSPHAKRGALYTAFRRHWAKDDARVLVWRGTTLEMNPTFNPAIVERAYEDDAQRASAEYGAQFRDDVSGYVTREVVDGCTAWDRHELPPRSGVQYLGFCDPSGGSADSMTMAVGHREDGRAVLDAVRERKPPFAPDGVVEEFSALLKQYRITTIVGDRYGGAWPAERFKVHGITYEPCERSKSQIYAELLPVLNSGQAELLDVPRLAMQLCSLERRTARGGRDSIDHPPGQHDDLANAVAGVLVRAAGRNSALDVWRRFTEQVTGEPFVIAPAGSA